MTYRSNPRVSFERAIDWLFPGSQSQPAGLGLETRVRVLDAKGRAAAINAMSRKLPADQARSLGVLRRVRAGVAKSTTGNLSAGQTATRIVRSAGALLAPAAAVCAVGFLVPVSVFGLPIGIAAVSLAWGSSAIERVGGGELQGYFPWAGAAWGRVHRITRQYESVASRRVATRAADMKILSDAVRAAERSNDSSSPGGGAHL